MGRVEGWKVGDDGRVWAWVWVWVWVGVFSMCCIKILCRQVTSITYYL